MTAFVKKVFAIMTAVAALLQSGAAFAVPEEFTPEDILSKRAQGRFNSVSNEEEVDFDPYEYSLEGYVIGIDPGHQLKGDARQEQVSPYNEDFSKDRMSPGASGVRSGAEEYEINLAVSLKIGKLLSAAGATVVMSRSTNDVNISNMERAKLMNEADADFWIRIHCNSSYSQRTNGALVIAPGSEMDIHGQSEALAMQVITEFCAATGAACRGVSYTDTQTGFNWSEIPVITIEMGYLSNPKEDVLLCRESYQNSCAHGIFSGIVAYCAEEDEA